MEVNSNKNDVRSSGDYIKALLKESQILHTKINLGSELIILDTDVTIRGVSTFLHTYYCPVEDNNPSAPTIVLLHGYGGSGLSFLHMFRALSKVFNIFAIDLIGMGLSGRCEFKVKEEAQDVVDFFVETIEQWRVARNLEVFYIAGHSFGGYIAANYAVKYEHHLAKVYLLSPMASTQISSELDLSNEENYKAYLKSLPFKTKLLTKFIRCQTDNKMTPGKLLDKWFVPANYMLKKIIRGRLKITDDHDIKLWKGYLKKVFQLPLSTDHYIHELLVFPRVQAKLSFEQVVNEKLNAGQKRMSVEFVILFGDSDWMSRKGCEELVNQSKILGEVIFIKDAGHQLPFDQPGSVVEEIIKRRGIIPQNNAGDLSTKSNSNNASK